MERLTMLVTPDGEWVFPNSEEFLARLGDATPDYDAISFAVKNLGFIKFQIDDRYARITLILDKIVHRDKSPTNGMIAKAIEICAQRKIPYLTYYLWRRGDHGKFQESVGFEKFPVPEYYVPLTMLGKIVLVLKLHHGWKSIIPEQVFGWLLDLRGNWYAKKLAARSMSPAIKSSVSLSRSSP